MADNMKSMRRTAAERKADNESRGGLSGSGDAPEHDDIYVRLEPHHIRKLGLDGPLPHGTAITLHGEGEVGNQSTEEGYSDAEPRHRMTLRLSRAALTHEEAPDEPRNGLRAELDRNTKDAEVRAADRAARRDTAKGRDGDKVPEAKGS